VEELGTKPLSVPIRIITMGVEAQVVEVTVMGMVAGTTILIIREVATMEMVVTITTMVETTGMSASIPPQPPFLCSLK